MRTAGMLTREGPAGGPNPTIQVLEVGKLGDKRDWTDILPFLPSMRSRLTPLPVEVQDMSLKVLRVPLADVECLTSTSVKMTGPIWYLNIRKGECKSVQDVSKS